MNKRTLGIALIIFGLLGSAYGGYAWVSNQIAHADLVGKVSNEKKEYQKKRSAYNKQIKVAQSQANHLAIKSTDKLPKAVAQQNIAYTKLNSAANKFFGVYYSWKNSSQYLARADKLDGLISDGLKHNKSIFDDGKDSAGGDYIKTTGIKARYTASETYIESANTASDLRGIVKVVYRGWFNDDTPSMAVRYYTMNYNAKTNQITSIKLMLTTNE